MLAIHGPPSFRAAASVLLLSAIASCQGDPESEPASPPPAQEMAEPQVHVSVDGGLLSQPVEIDVDSAGHVYIVDRNQQAVLAISPDGQVVRRIGGPGKGPGELVRPLFLDVRGDTLLVYDHGRGRTEIFTSGGTHARGFPTVLAGAPSQLTFGPGGVIAYSTLFGPDKCGLVTLLNPRQGVERCLGELVSQDQSIPPNFLDIVHDRQVPGFMRNHVLPVFSPAGTLWVFLQTEGILLHYDRGGVLLSREWLPVPEARDIRAEYFDWYARIFSRVLRPFSYVSDGSLVDGRLWLLWNTPRGQPVAVTIHDDSGRVTSRLLLKGMDQISPEWSDGRPRRRFAIDLPRRRLYLLDTSTATVIWFALPHDLH